jgi:hypothetical protein
MLTNDRTPIFAGFNLAVAFVALLLAARLSAQQSPVTVLHSFFNYAEHRGLRV